MTACSSGSDRKSTRLNSSHMSISYAVFCLKKKKNKILAEQLQTIKKNLLGRIEKLSVDMYATRRFAFAQHFKNFYLFFFLIIRPPPISPLFPYTTLFRSSLSSRSRASTTPRFTNAFRHGSHGRSEEHTSELQSHVNLVCRLLLEKKKKKKKAQTKKKKQEKKKEKK